MKGQADSPQNRPEVVFMGKVGQLMGQAVAQDPLIRCRFLGQIDGRVKQPEQAGRPGRP